MNLSLTDGMIFFLPVLQTLAGEGRVYKCLFNHKFEEAMSERVSAVHIIYNVFYLLSRDNIDLHSYPMGPENSAAFTWASPKYLTQIIVFSDELHFSWENEVFMFILLLTKVETRLIIDHHKVWRSDVMLMVGLCPQCREALTTRQKLIAQDYKVSYSLAKACKSDLRKYRCSADSNMPRAREARLSYLLLCLESAVHRGK